MVWRGQKCGDGGHPLWYLGGSQKYRQDNKKAIGVKGADLHMEE